MDKVSLRKKRTVKPKISAPSNFQKVGGSGPLPPATTSDGRASAERDQQQAPASGGLPGGPRPRPRERPQNGDATADLVKRRYSTRFAQAPDFSVGAPPVPSVPSIPGRFAVQPPSRDGPPGGGERVKVDTKALRDPNLRPEQCTTSKSLPEQAIDLAQMLRQLSPTLPNPKYKPSNPISAK